KHFSIIGSSNLMKIGDEFFENIRIAAHSSDNQIIVQNLAAGFQGKTYRLAKPATIDIKDKKAICNEIRINDTLVGSFEYKNDTINAKAKISDFAYRDSNRLSFILDADVLAEYKGQKLSVEGDAYLKDLRAAFELKSSNITKDKDIVILKPKMVQFDERKFDENIALRLNITTANKAIYRSKEAYAPISVNMLYYKDFGQKPMMLGLIKTEGGYYDMEGKRFLLQPGSIALTPSEPNNPYLNLTLKHIDKDTQISIFVKGFASSPKLSFSSNPAMSEKEIISYLLFGVDPESGFSKDSNDAKYSSKAIGALSNALSRDLTKEFGIKLDKVEISPTEVTDKTGRTTQTTKVEVGKRITKDLTVTYKNDIESSVVFEYQINKNVSVESQAGRKSSIDIFYKQDY
ncbi:MAG TPA: translocation/assembly module TamB domain-containing protein, partial [Campylobacterales bacterium]|nr:translocation/assembly module TamB domain-containing protein [Campylobacterales bacterium]